jgi:hypothetical protein
MLSGRQVYEYVGDDQNPSEIPEAKLIDKRVEKERLKNHGSIVRKFYRYKLPNKEKFILNINLVECRYYCKYDWEYKEEEYFTFYVTLESFE